MAGRRGTGPGAGTPVGGQTGGGIGAAAGERGKLNLCGSLKTCL